MHVALNVFVQDRLLVILNCQNKNGASGAFNTFLAGFLLSPFMFGLATGPPQDKLRLCDKRDLKVKTIL